ncbi:MAG: DUF4864 domain-containing protein [Geminicoccaceae bacterium]
MMVRPVGNTRRAAMRGGLALLLGLCLCIVAGISVARSDVADSLSDADRTAIRNVIQAQIAAFRADDDLLAFSFATPSIQNRFGDASSFIAMVKRGYLPVYRPRHVEFSELLDVQGKLAQRVVVVGPDSSVFSAYYLMQRQPDGDWRISGCVLRPIGDRAI